MRDYSLITAVGRARRIEIFGSLELAKAAATSASATYEIVTHDIVDGLPVEIDRISYKPGT